MGRHRFLRKRWAIVYAVCALVSLFDTAAAAANRGRGFRLSRILRPLLVTAHIRPLRQLTGSFLRMAPRIWSVMALVRRPLRHAARRCPPHAA